MDEENELPKRMCRLCAQRKEVTVTLYSEQGKDMLLHEKLSKYLLIELIKNDSLPKNICIKCCAKLHTLCEFVEEVRQAQLFFYRSIANPNNTKPKQCQKHNKVAISTTLKNALTEPSCSNNDTEVNSTQTDEDSTVNIMKDDKNSVNKNKAVLRKLFACNVCNRGFTTDLALQNHLWKHKVEFNDWNPRINTKKTIRCIFCSRRFHTVRTHAAHMKMHLSGCKIETCRICGRAYGNRSKLIQHSITHRDKTHCCKLCPKKYKTNSELKVHMKKHISKHEITNVSTENAHCMLSQPDQVKQEMDIILAKITNVHNPNIDNDSGHHEVNINLVKEEDMFKYQCQ